MNEKIEQILQELYRTDPELKKEEALIRKILADMYAVRPEISADPAFIASLRNTILEKARAMSVVPRKSLFFKMSHYDKFVVAGMAAMVLMIASAIFFSGNIANRVPGVAVDELSENAFGPLVYQTAPGGFGGGGFRSQSGGGGGGGGMMMSAPAIGADGKEIASPLIYPGPDYTQSKYIYEGDDFEIPLQGSVYKRKVSPASARTVISALKDFPLSKLKNPAIGDLTLVEDREYGYNISVSLREGWISFFQNWEKWPVQDVGCATEECYRRDFLAPSQFPAEESIVGIADSFLREYGINMSAYGPGKVIQPWRFTQFYPGMPDPMSQIYPPEINVLYPLEIDGTRVYDEWGSPIGINVYVNLKLNRVTSASNISVHGYDKSNYALVTDKAKILEVASAGGATGDAIIMGWQGRTIEIKIGAPEIVYMQFYTYLNGKSEMMYVPAFRFPVTNIPSNASFYKENVIVPLVPDILDRLAERKIAPPMPVEPMPMPMTEPAPPSSIEPGGTVSPQQMYQ